MHIVVIYGWENEEADSARIIAENLGIIVFEARQKIIGGGPIVLKSFADQTPAGELAAILSQAGVPAFTIDTNKDRTANQAFHVNRFVLGEKELELESAGGDKRRIEFSAVDLLLLATGSSGSIQTVSTVTERKLSLGKTLLAGGVPMSKKIKTEQTVTQEERSETLRLYTGDSAPVIFDRTTMNYDGLGDAMQLTRDLNFTYLKNELKRLAPQAIFDDRLLKRAELSRLLGPNLSPESDLDFAFEILARSLRPQPDSTSIPDC